MDDLVEELRSGHRIGMHQRLCKAADEIERLRKAIKAIQRATIEGRVCDDVAWFDTITTLHDFCDQTLSPAERTDVEKTGEGQ